MVKIYSHTSNKTYKALGTIFYENAGVFKAIFVIDNDPTKDPNAREVRFSEELQFRKNYMEINGQRFDYKNMDGNVDRICALIHHDQTISAIEALP